jgi:hypothetical protein
MAPGNSPGDVRRRSRVKPAERCRPGMLNKINKTSYIFDNTHKYAYIRRRPSALAPLRADGRCGRDAAVSGRADRVLGAGIVWAANQPD